MSGFRHGYLDYDALTQQLRTWEKAHPGLVRVTSIARTPEGRDVWLVTIGPEPDRVRPAVWVDGNVHACELAGSSVALAIAEDAIALHTNPDSLSLPTPVVDALRQVLFYVLPRITPDGADCVMRTGRSVRSVPRDSRVERGTPRWIPQDVDGDGLALAMRVEDPAGELVESREVTGLLVERTIDDVGPFYKLYPEGLIEHFDGRRVPSPDYLGDNPVDLNRNFPWSWAPPHEQAGAGAYPASEPEVRGIVEFASAHPEIFAWCNYHTFGGVLIRPPGDTPDSKMDQEDLALYRQLEAWMTEHTGYPTVSGYEEFLYQPDKPLRGDLSEFAYMQRGALGYAIELWDLHKRLEIKQPKKFVDYYNHYTRADLEKFAKWDREHNEGRVFPKWRAYAHPQLGAVEIGGIDPRIGMWNPPYTELPALCRTQANVFLRVAALAPRVQIGRIDKKTLPGDMTRIDVRVENVGYLGTYGVPSAKKLAFNEPLYATARAVKGELVDPGAVHQIVGHLDGWGHGLHTGANLQAYPGTRGTTNAGWLTYLLRGPGVLEIKVGSCRTGFVTTVIE
jgi:hypothetical protein